MKSVLIEPSPEPPIRHSPGTDFESEETRYAGREPQEISTDPAETLDEEGTAEAVRSFVGLYSTGENTEEAGDGLREQGVVESPEERSEAESPVATEAGDLVAHRVLDNTVPFHPEDPLRETN